MTNPTGEVPERNAPQLAADLQQFRVYGCATPMSHSMTHDVRPSQAAAMFADLAARLAELGDSPAGEDLRLAVHLSIVPWIAAGSEADRMGTADMIGSAVLPSVPAERQLMPGGSVQYVVQGRTAAGLVVTTSMPVEPTEAEEVEYATQVFHKRARAVGCVPQPVSVGSSNAGELVQITCACGQFTSAATSEADGLRDWRDHAASVMGAPR